MLRPPAPAVPPGAAPPQQPPRQQRGGNQPQRQQPKLCSVCNRNVPPEGRDACLACVPKFDIQASWHHVDAVDGPNPQPAKEQVSFQTYKNDVQESCPFCYAVPGKAEVTVTAVENATGKWLVDLDESDKKRVVKYYIVGGNTGIKTIPIPSVRERFHPQPYNSAKGFWGNLLEAVKGQ